MAQKRYKPKARLEQYEAGDGVNGNSYYFQLADGDVLRIQELEKDEDLGIPQCVTLSVFTKKVWDRKFGDYGMNPGDLPDFSELPKWEDGEEMVITRGEIRICER